MEYIFSYNLPQDNNFCNLPDYFMYAVTKWDGKSFYTFKDKSPIVHAEFINLSMSDIYMVHDWRKALKDIQEIGEQHFMEIVQERKHREMEFEKVFDDTVKPIGDIHVSENGKASAITLHEFD